MRSSNGRLPQNRQSIQRRSNLAKHGLAGHRFKSCLKDTFDPGHSSSPTTQTTVRSMLLTFAPEAGYLSVPISGNVEVSMRS